MPPSRRVLEADHADPARLSRKGIRRSPNQQVRCDRRPAVVHHAAVHDGSVGHTATVLRGRIGKQLSQTIETRIRRRERSPGAGPPTTRSTHSSHHPARPTLYAHRRAADEHEQSQLVLLRADVDVDTVGPQVVVVHARQIPGVAGSPSRTGPVPRRRDRRGGRSQEARPPPPRRRWSAPPQSDGCRAHHQPPLMLIALTGVAAM
jgi:hypothetical protein